MGSAIGNYIHYSALGYDRSGVSMRGKYRAPIYGYIMNRIRQNLQQTSSGATPQELKEFGDTLTAFMNKPESFEKGLEAQTAIEQDLFEKFEKDMSKAILNFDSMTVSGISTAGALGKVSAHKTANGKGLYMDLREITNKINKIEEIYLKKMNQKSVNTREFRELRAAYAKLVGESAKTLKKYNFKKNPRDLKLEGSYKDIGELRSKLNALIEEYAAYPDIVGIEGLAFEDAIALVPYVAEETAYDNALDAIKASVTGGKSVRIEQYDKKNFNMKSIRKQLGEDTFLDTYYNQRAKIDVELNWKGKDFKISAKNVTFKDTHTWIDVASGSPLLSMVQDLESDFVNHWINMHAVHGRSNTAATYKSDMDDTMKSFLLYRSMTGNASNRNLRDNANLLIVNDKTKKNGVIVKDMKTVFEKALENLNRVSLQLNGVRLNQLKLKNIWNKDSYQGRLAAVLMELHSLKVEAGFNANVILK